MSIYDEGRPHTDKHTICIKCYDAAIAEEVDATDALRTRMSDLLTRTADALLGEPAPLSTHSWAHLPDAAGDMKDRADVAERERDELKAKYEQECAGTWSRLGQIGNLTRERDAALASAERAEVLLKAVHGALADALPHEPLPGLDEDVSALLRRAIAAARRDAVEYAVRFMSPDAWRAEAARIVSEMEAKP